MANSNNTKMIFWVARSALLLALLVVVQIISKVIPTAAFPTVSQIVTGSLVNLVLIVGAGSVGFSGAAIAAVLSPVLALAFGQMKFPLMVPVVMIGNLVIVAITWGAFRAARGLNKKAGMATNIAGVIVGAIIKCVFLWAAATVVVIPILDLPAKMATVVATMFSWPQLITALIGGALALLVLPALKVNRSSSASSSSN